jgi:RNA polymerase sigma factor (TIGR02999 family)
MTSKPTGTDIGTEFRGGSRELDRLVPLVYEELRQIAHRHLRRRANNNGDTTLATTALVNEVYLKLVDQTDGRWHDRAHFLALASVAMRHILIDGARARMAGKRGGAHVRVTLDDEALAYDRSPVALLEIDEALTALAATDARLARVVECRFFGGLSEEETAQALGVTTRTVQRDWVKARALLHRALGEGK